MDIHPDISARKHRGSETSVAANPTLQAKRADHRTILGLLAQGDMTSKEIADAMGKPLNAISGRLSELRVDLGLIRKTGARRDGCAVLELVKEFENGLF